MLIDVCRLEIGMYSRKIKHIMQLWSFEYASLKHYNLRGGRLQ